MARFVNPVAAAERRRAISAGLAAVLATDDIEAALLLWDSAYAELKPHAVADFVEAVATRLRLGSGERLKLRMSVMHTVLVSLQTRPAAAQAGTGMNGARAAPAPPAPPPPKPGVSLNPALTVFVRMAERMLTGIRRHGGAAQQHFLDAFRRQLGHAESPLPLQAPALLRWASGLTEAPAFSGVSDHGLAQLLHLIYVATAQALGPVTADTLLTQAVTQAELLPEAVRFPPRRLL